MHGPEQAEPIRASDFGITHFALYTDDIDASVERFQKAGGTPLTAPRPIPYATEKGPGNKVCYCRMPWGTTMEFITTPDRMPIATGRICADGRTRNKQSAKATGPKK
jgi:uncharacterized protein (DUF2237 family)